MIGDVEGEEKFEGDDAIQRFDTVKIYTCYYCRTTIIKKTNKGSMVS